jgi:hypothetical protein
MGHHVIRARIRRPFTAKGRIQPRATSYFVHWGGILGALENWKKVTVSFFMSVCMSVRLSARLASHWTKFC